jgi:hypothetical protein
MRPPSESPKLTLPLQINDHGPLLAGRLRSGRHTPTSTRLSDGEFFIGPDRLQGFAAVPHETSLS